MDVNALGLKAVQGHDLTETSYWDTIEENGAWTRRWQMARPGKFPTMGTCGHLFLGVSRFESGSIPEKVTPMAGRLVAGMKEMSTDDPLFGEGHVRADGRKMHPAYLFEVKKPEESKYPGDDYKLLAAIPADEAFRPMTDGQCPMVNGR